MSEKGLKMVSKMLVSVIGGLTAALVWHSTGLADVIDGLLSG